MRTPICAPTLHSPLAAADAVLFVALPAPAPPICCPGSAISGRGRGDAAYPQHTADLLQSSDSSCQGPVRSPLTGKIARGGARKLTAFHTFRGTLPATSPWPLPPLDWDPLSGAGGAGGISVSSANPRTSAKQRVRRLAQAPPHMLLPHATKSMTHAPRSEESKIYAWAFGSVRTVVSGERISVSVDVVHNVEAN